MYLDSTLQYLQLRHLMVRKYQLFRKSHMSSPWQHFSGLKCGHLSDLAVFMAPLFGMVPSFSIFILGRCRRCLTSWMLRRGVAATPCCHGHVVESRYVSRFISSGERKGQTAEVLSTAERSAMVLRMRTALGAWFQRGKGQVANEPSLSH